MVPGMWRVFGGAALVVAGIAAFIEAHTHKPVGGILEQYVRGGPTEVIRPASGLSPTAYDLLRIGAWALVIFGALLIVVGLIAYWGAQRRSDARA